jgi:hypothetical protein
VPTFSIHFEEIPSRDHGNFEEQNEVLESSIIIINYCDIILMRIIINAKCLIIILYF